MKLGATEQEYPELEDHEVVVPAVSEGPAVVALAVLQCAGDVEAPTGGGDDGKAWRQFDPGGEAGVS